MGEPTRDPAREGIGRRVTLLRLWGAAVTLLPGVGLVPHGGWPLLGIGLLVEGVQAYLSYQLVQQVQHGREGELLYIAGGRVPMRLVRAQQGLEQAGLGISAVGMVWLLALATPWTLTHAALCLVLWITVFLSFRVQWRSARLLQLLHSHQQQEALRLSERWSQGRFGSLLTPLHAIALLMNRRVVEARGLRAQAWNGVVGRSTVGIALDRIHQGDGSLARSVIDFLDGQDTYARYGRAVLGGHLAVVEQDTNFQIPESLVDDLPATMATELRLIEAALARQRGDDALAQRCLAPVDLDAESWRAAAYPTVWEALGRRAEASAPVPRPGPEPVHDAFRPPSEASEGPRRRWAVVGGVPATRAPLTVRWSPWLQGLMALLGLLILALGSLLLGLTVVGDLVGAPAPEGVPELGGIGVAIAVFLVGRYAVQHFATRTDRGILLEDERILDPARPVLLYLHVSLPFVSAVVLVPALAVSLAALTEWWILVLSFVAIWVALFTVQGVRRLRLVRLVRAIHIGSDDQLARCTQGIHASGRAWAVLAHFLRGDAEAARQAGEQVLLVADDATALLRWDAAARGDLTVEAIRSLPRSADPGHRFCREVSLRLAALREDRASLVQEASPDDLHLPNRIGDGLRVLEYEIERRLDPAAAKRTAVRMAPELRRGAWIRRCWPNVFESSR